MFVAIRYSHERTELRPSKRGSARQRAQQRVLQGVLGVLHGAEHPVAVGVQLAAMRFHQLAEGTLVTGARGGQQRVAHRGPLRMAEFAIRTSSRRGTFASIVYSVRRSRHSMLGGAHEAPQRDGR